MEVVQGSADSRETEFFRPNGWQECPCGWSEDGWSEDGWSRERAHRVSERTRCPYGWRDDSTQLDAKKLGFYLETCLERNNEWLVLLHPNLHY